MALSDTIVATDVCRGVSRLLVGLGYAPTTEFKLGNGRRVDVAGINRQGMIVAVEVKVSVIDLRTDLKWPDYLGFCDCFFFAVPPHFPRAILDEEQFQPARTGLIIADRFEAAIIRPAPEVKINTSRRRAETLRFARTTAYRLNSVSDQSVIKGP